MRSTSFLIVLLLSIFNRVTAQIISADEIGHALNDKFSYDGQDIPHSGIKWTLDSWQAGDPTMWTSGYGGIKFFTTDNVRMAISANGNVGVGTSNPAAILDVGKFIGNGAIGTVLARQMEGNTTGDGTFLGTRAWETQQNIYNGKEFSLENHFYGEVNNAINFYRGGSITGGYMTFSTNNGTEQMLIDANGNVGIGTNAPTDKLSVNGSIRAKEIKVETANWPDYVFDKEYKLLSLDSLFATIQSEGHLPDMPAAKEVESQGQNLGKITAQQQQKIEELTLYAIQVHQQMAMEEKENSRQKKLLQQQEKEIIALKTAVNQLIAEKKK